MLVLSRKPNEVIRIGENVRITVVRVHGDTVRLGIEAPSDVPVMREELIIDVPSEPVTTDRPEMEWV